jgi:hypothetical protein
MGAAVAALTGLAALGVGASGCRDGGVTTGAAPGPVEGAGGISTAARPAEPPFDLPGATPMPADVRTRLAAALAAGTAAGAPVRTRHRDVTGRPRFANRLLLETSPYLLQHAHNPVDWYAWGDDAFERARREGRPILLSIGYSTCHWCHVMEEESFEDLEIAELLNRRYVAIKVDREERPDVDAVYMTAVQLLTGRGGWPLTVWLTPDRRPLSGGTYFPPRAGVRGATRGFIDLLRELADEYAADPSGVAGRASTLAARVVAASAPEAGAGDLPAGAMADGVAALARSFDAVHGGFGGAPKFPRTSTVELLLRHWRRSGDPAALDMAVRTLDAIAAGGIHDHVGGGFHRYSTDTAWLVPHFEKMLYDNALLASAFVEGWRATGRPEHRRVAARALDWILREMRDPGGAFYAATDADSIGPGGEAEEGAFFVWTPDQVRNALALGGAGSDAVAAAIATLGLDGPANFEGGRWVLRLARAPGDAAGWAALDAALERLRVTRESRARPHRDDKILAGWNGLAIGALARAGFAFREPRYLEAAGAAARFLLERLPGPDGRVRRGFTAGRPIDAPAYADDLALLAAGLLDLFEATADAVWLEAAIRVQAQLDAHHADDVAGAWFLAPADGEDLLARSKEDYDGALPAFGSVAAENLLRLEALTGDTAAGERARRALRAFAGTVARAPAALPRLLVAHDFALGPAKEIVVVWPAGADPEPLLAPLRTRVLPPHVLVAGPAATIAALGVLVPPLRDKSPIGSRPTAFVCERGRCELPTSDPGVLAAQLALAPSP